MIDNQQIIEELIKPETDESANAYSAFLFWASLPQSKRSGEEALKKVGKHVGLEPTTIKQYRVNYNWDERSNLIDAHLFKLNFDERLKLSQEDNKRFASEMKEIQTQAIRIVRKGLNAVEMLVDTLPLDSKVVETDWVQAKQADGTHKPVPTKTIVNMKSEAKDIAPLLRALVDVPAKVLGLKTEVIEPEVVQTVPKDNMTLDDIAEAKRRIAKEKEKLLNVTTVQ